MSDGVVPDSPTDINTDQRLVKSVVRHLEPSVARDRDNRVVHHVSCTQLAVVWWRQASTVYHCTKARLRSMASEWTK